MPEASTPESRAPEPPRVVAAFDFDGTLTRRDTLKPFLLRAFGLPRVAWTFLRLAPLACRVAAGREGVDEFKRRAIARLFAGADPAPLRAAGLAHAQAWLPRVRPAARARIAWHRAQGHRLVLVSASLDLYLAPLARELGFDDLLCTRCALVDTPAGPRHDGRLDGPDCTGPAKVQLLEALVGDLRRVDLHAYGDSRGDRELLAAARHPHVRPFR